MNRYAFTSNVPRVKTIFYEKGDSFKLVHSTLSEDNFNHYSTTENGVKILRSDIFPNKITLRDKISPKSWNINDHYKVLTEKSIRDHYEPL